MKLALLVAFAVILALPFAYWADEEIDKGLRAWYERMYSAPYGHGYTCEEMPYGYSLYSLGWRILINVTPSVADVLWPRPDFEKRINISEYDIYYYGCGIDDDTVIVVDKE